MLAKSLISKMNAADRSKVRDGAGYCTLMFGGIAYWNYRERLHKEFKRSEAHYRLSRMIENMTPWKQLYFSWWRMPKETFNVYHRFKPYYILGQLDQTKEVLLPKKNAQGADGFDVINPLYCYECGKTSFRELINGGDPVIVERAALIVNRGWIPASLRDKRSRPEEVNSRKLVRLTGVFRAGKDIHDYKVPNNPDNNDWHNLALEDIGIFWDLPNWDEAKYYYFHCTAVPGGSNSGCGAATPLAPDELVDDHYGWRWSEHTHNKFEKCFGAASLGMLAITYFAL